MQSQICWGKILVIKNYMEQVIEEELPNLLKDYVVKNQDVCMCEKCQSDLKCIALNNLKPAYFTTELGSVYLKSENLNPQYHTDVISELTKAADIVFKNKRHNIE